MTRDEFYKAATKSGYGCGKTTEDFIKQSGKDVFTAADFIDLYRYHEATMERFSNRSVTKGRFRDVLSRDGSHAKTSKHYINTSGDSK